MTASSPQDYSVFQLNFKAALEDGTRAIGNWQGRGASVDHSVLTYATTTRCSSNSKRLGYIDKFMGRVPRHSQRQIQAHTGESS